LENQTAIHAAAQQGCAALLSSYFESVMQIDRECEQQYQRHIQNKSLSAAKNLILPLSNKEAIRYQKSFRQRILRMARWEYRFMKNYVKNRNSKQFNHFNNTYHTSGHSSSFLGSTHRATRRCTWP